MAIPAILQQLNQGKTINPQINQIKDLMGMFKNANDPQALMRSLAAQNPRIQQTLSLIGESGVSAKEAFYKLAEQKGVDPNEILDALK